MSILKNAISKIQKRLNPCGYWRKQGAVIGDNCEIYPSANFMEPYLIEIGHHVRINESVNFVTHDGGVWVLRGLGKEKQDENIDIFGKIRIGNNVHIATNVTIMPNVKIGSNVIVGCGAIVTHDIPDNSIVVGIPARVIESVDEYYEKNRSRFVYTKQMTNKEKRKYLMQYFKEDIGVKEDESFQK